MNDMKIKQDMSSFQVKIICFETFNQEEETGMNGNGW